MEMIMFLVNCAMALWTIHHWFFVVTPMRNKLMRIAEFLEDSYPNHISTLTHATRLKAMARKMRQTSESDIFGNK